VSGTSQRYLSEEYAEKNPTWDMEDSRWKAERVAAILDEAGIRPVKICEVGCGAGRVLEALAGMYPQASFAGYDIAPAAARFWADVDASRIAFKVGDFFALDHEHYDVILLLDVLEHVADPHAFLGGLRGRSDYLVVHFPLDLSALSVLRETPLLRVRRKVGHIHYFTKSLALELMNECGFEIIDHRFTGAAFNAPQATLKTRLAQIPRRLLAAVNRDFGARLLGGETLMVLVRAR
jgi:SAM-dependent methyltransferase